MGLWGAAQAIAFALGGFIGTLAIDTARLFIAEPAFAYAIVFSGEALLFIAAAMLGLKVCGVSPMAKHNLMVGDADFIDMARGKS